MAVVPSWDEFVRINLLQENVVSGVSLLSRQGVPVYSYRDLENLDQVELQQFLKLFHCMTSQGVINSGFVLSTEAGKQTQFKVYHKTYCSVYATSPGNTEGLVASRVPQGILLCSFRHPVHSGAAVKHVEHFCDLLRA